MTFRVNNSLSRDDVKAIKCDHSTTDTLRLGHTYAFHADLSLDSGKARLSDINFWFSADEDYNGDQHTALFHPTEELNRADWDAGTTPKRVLQSTDYHVRKAPERRQPDNVIIKYEFLYHAYLPDGSLDKQERRIVQCVNYAVTRCGDGVVDKDFGEECDSGQPDGSPTCTRECKQVKK